MAVRKDEIQYGGDAELVERFQAGEREAFEELYRRHYPPLRRYCIRRLGNAAEGEEVAQDAFIRAYGALPRFAGERRFYPWLRVIAANLCADIQRRGGRVSTAEVPEESVPDVALDRLVDEAQLAQLRASMAGVSPRHRAALELWAEGVPSRTIAAEMDASVGAVEVLLHRARAALRRRFVALERDAWGAVPVIGIGVRALRRVRAGVQTQAAEHAETLSPLATKAVAVLIAVAATGVTGGTPATAGGTAVQLTRPAAMSAAPLQQDRLGGTTSGAAARAVAPNNAPAGRSRSSTEHATPSSGGTAAGDRPYVNTPVARVMSYDAAKREGADAPIQVTAGKAFIAIDPRVSPRRARVDIDPPRGVGH